MNSAPPDGWADAFQASSPRSPLDEDGGGGSRQPAHQDGQGADASRRQVQRRVRGGERQAGKDDEPRGRHWKGGRDAGRRGKHDEAEPVAKDSAAQKPPKRSSGRSGRSSRNKAFFSGYEALAEVAKADGELNWAMVGAEPDKLPLSGSGAGGVEEMRNTLGEHMVSFGLLRLEFSTGTSTKTQLVYFSAVMGSGRQKERSLAAINGKKVRQAILDGIVGGAADLEIEVQNPDDISVLAFCARCSENDADYVTYTVKNYRKGLKKFQDRHSDEAPPREEEDTFEEDPVKAAREQAAREQMQNIESQVLDDLLSEDYSQTMQPSMSLEDGDAADRAKIDDGSFKVGDAVMVFCDSARQWIDDGAILLILRQTESYDGYQLPQGAVKVQYCGGRRFKWVLEEQVERFLQPSERPTPPSPMMGELFKETHNVITEWHVRHVEINRGYMQWWQNPDDARIGMKPNAVAMLSGMIFHVDDDSTVFKFSTAGTKGTVYSFDATSPEGRERWVAALARHGSYCEHIQAYNRRIQRAAEGGAEGKPAK